MTMMGPKYVVACPHCGQMIKADSYVSVTIIDPKDWTDGYTSSPMLPHISNLEKCPTCNNLFYTSDAKELGSYMWNTMYFLDKEPERFKEENPKLWEHIHQNKQQLEHEFKLYKNSVSAAIPHESDYLAFIENNSLTSEQERNIRLLVWWKANYRNRSMFENLPVFYDKPFLTEALKDSTEYTSGLTNVLFSQEHLENMEELSKLMDENIPDDRIMKAEIARERGMFDEAMRLLDYQYTDDNSDRAKVISYLCSMKVSCVADINSTLSEMSK